MVSTLTSEGNTWLLLSLFSYVLWCLFWFSMHRTPPAMPFMTMLISSSKLALVNVSQSGWVFIPSSEKTTTSSLHQCLCVDSVVGDFDQNCTKQETKAEVTMRQGFTVKQGVTTIHKDSAAYWAIQAGLLTPLTFARHHLSPFTAFTSGAYFLHNGRRWQWICKFYTANSKGIFGGP